MTYRDEYFLGDRRTEQERLVQQAEQIGHETAWLFEEIGLAVGERALEIGCGPRGCLDLLAARVGTSGGVVGIERNEDAVDLARKFVAERGLRNVEVHHRDARSSGLPKDSFDLVTARLVLVNVPTPEQIVAEAVALARPGGSVAFHEADWAAMVCDPPSHAWTTLVDLFMNYTKANGIDLFIGRKLPRLLRDAGLVDVHVNPIVHVHPSGNPCRQTLLDFAENVRERILAQNIIAEQDFSNLTEGLKQHLDNPDTLVVHGPFFQVWGRKPK